MYKRQDIDKIEAAITPKTKGVMIVHLYGRIAYNDKLGEICKKHNLKLMDVRPETPFEGEPMAVTREPNDMEKSLL